MSLSVLEQSVLNQNLFLVKEHTGWFKAANEFDIYDPNTGEVVLLCREPNLGFLTKMFRFSDYKRMTPFEIIISTPDDKKLITIKRGISVFGSTVEVLNSHDELIGKFKQKLFSLGGAFNLLDPNGQELAKLKGNWSSWDFKFTASDGTEFASINKKWAGIGRELFTTADNYVLQVSEQVPPNHPLRSLVIAAVMCIDMVLKE
jgi:uncharacterized protein YxjI